jgi:hypothetical protein
MRLPLQVKFGKYEAAWLLGSYRNTPLVHSVPHSQLAAVQRDAIKITANSSSPFELPNEILQQQVASATAVTSVSTLPSVDSSVDSSSKTERLPHVHHSK